MRLPRPLLSALLLALAAAPAAAEAPAAAPVEHAAPAAAPPPPAPEHAAPEALALPEAVQVAPALLARGIPPVPAALDERLRQYQNTRAATFQDWIDGGRGGLLVTTRFGETAQLHRVEEPLAFREQLTFEAEPVQDAVWATWRGRPGAFYRRDVGGAEAYQVFFFDPAAGTHTRLTDGASRNVGLRLSRDGRRLAFSSNARNGKDFDLWLLDLDQAEPRKLLDREGLWVAVDFSPDGREMLVQHYVSANESSYHRVDLALATARPLMTLNDPKVAFGPARYGPKGQKVYVASDQWGEHLHLAELDLASGGARLLTADLPWDVTHLELDPRGRYLAFVTNEGGVSRLNVWSRASRRPVRLPDLPLGVIGGLAFDARGRQLALSIDSARGPSDVYTVDLGRRRLTRWTQSEIGGLDPARFVEPRLVSFPTFDTVDGRPREIPAFYYRPPGDGPFPVVVYIHGGPESQFRPYFSATVQSWVAELGLAVVAPNVRGSAGYGKSYLLLDNGMKREDSVKDIGALLDWIGRQPELDAARVGVFGGSYGGYMVLASMARFADRLRAGAEIVGISNFVTFLENTQAYRRDLRRAEYGDERDPDMRAFLEAISPTRLADRITRPLYVAQGANDPRVPATESEQIVREVAARDVPVWYLLAEDEGHGFAKKKNRDYYTASLALFWQEHLLK